MLYEAWAGYNDARRETEAEMEEEEQEVRWGRCCEGVELTSCPPVAGIR